MKKSRVFYFTVIIAFGFAGLGLSSCSGARDTLGLTKKPPDEFAVVKRAPLSMPPDYALRPPQPGVARPQEQEMSEEARQAVFGNEQISGTAVPSGNAENALLREAGTEISDPAIRQKVDSETASLGDQNKPVAQKLLGIIKPSDTPSATVVNATEESKRLQKNAEEGKPVTEGQTPSIEE
ncbi:MAG: DUF3035 domain-containing protein [Alphaproteobacteria bacterium]|nr:DUF3035 domain-containing protein [Alphaproteobacteria bacterium]